jgi:Icc-related predicted phosphoesterase
MKVALGSDLHLEFGDINLQNTENVDVLILSGDICVAKDIGRPDPDNIFEGSRSSRIVDFFKRCSFAFPRTIYVMGNHEHYHGDVAKSASILKSMLASNMLSNVHLLEKESIDIGDVRFIGGTLWTDMNGGCEQTMRYVSRRMNDFQCCENSAKQVSYRTMEPVLDEYGTPKVDAEGKMIYQAVFHTRGASWSPEDAAEDHKKMLDYISHVYQDTPPWMSTVVVGHHAPSKGSEHPRYKHDTLMNGAYNSRLEDFILARPGIKLWTHGHTHEDFDYMLGSTRVVCNPRGYINYEERAERFELKVLEV